MTVLTGATGCGKTTFLCEYSLDFCIKGVPTLWCSFELKNEVVLTSMLRQLSGEELSDSSKSFDYWADQFERLPMYFQTFFGSTDIKKVLNLIDYSIYAYNVTHIILDNLQFMLSGQGKGFERFEMQDDLISQLRTIATERNVHITLVIHPKKTDDAQDLNIASIFGTSKATQEADNIFIIQNRSKFKILDIKKNRYDGEVGRVPMLFHKPSKKFYTINNMEVDKLVAGTDPQEILMAKIKQNGQDYKNLMDEVFREGAHKSLDSVELLLDQPENAEQTAGTDSVFSMDSADPLDKDAAQNYEDEKRLLEMDSDELPNENPKADEETLKAEGPKDEFTVFDQHFRNPDVDADSSASDSHQNVRQITEGKWTVNNDNSIHFYPDGVPSMTYEDIINEYVSPQRKKNWEFKKKQMK